jgi:hypothetical protein
MLTVKDGLGQCHTVLCDAVALQAFTHSDLLPAFPDIYGEAAVCAMGHTRILHQLMDRLHVLADLLVLAG